MAGQSHPWVNPENLAQIFQELLTVVVRLRANRQAVQDAESFRAQIRTALAAAEQQAVRRGHNQEDVRAAIFAIVAFLDETVLNSRNPLFADWPRKPLQEELFGVHVAGEIFFRNVERLLGRSDSPQLEELLEVYQLCLLLGFRGRYSTGSGSEVRSFSQSIGEKRRRIRGISPYLSPQCQPPEDFAPPMADPWLRRLTLAAAGSLIFAAGLFAIYKLSLMSAGSAL
jgi:type VI secretion system protein ImpK